MESNNINQEYFEGAVSLDEPHFDEEATVLSARPVVPLQEIKAEEQSRKRLIVGLAMACSLTMGALAATLVYKQRGEGQSTAISTAVPGAAGIVVNDPASSSATSVEEQLQVHCRRPARQRPRRNRYPRSPAAQRQPQSSCNKKRTCLSKWMNEN